MAGSFVTRSGRVGAAGGAASASLWARIWPIVGIVAGPLALAALGTTHPMHLDGMTAGWWYHLHLILIPLFPLLGLNLWWLLAGERGPLAWVARVAAFVYLTFYGGLDMLAGAAAGLVRDKATQGGTGEFANVEPWLFSAGNQLGDIGAFAFLIGSLITAGLLLARHGGRAVPGAALLLIGALIFTRSHIYFPVGVGAMLLLAAGCGALQWVRLHPTKEN